MSRNAYAVANYFLKLSELCVDQQVTKKVLNDSIDFNAYFLFHIISNHNEYIQPHSISIYLSTLGLELNIDEATKILRTISKTQATKIGMKEFIEFTCDSEYWKDMATKRTHHIVSYQTQFLLGKLLIKEHNIICTVEKYQTEIDLLPNMSIYETFSIINADKRKYITEKQITQFMLKYLHRNSIPATNIKALISRIDKDCDGVIGFIDFFDALKMYYQESNGYSNTPIKCYPISEPTQTASKINKNKLNKDKSSSFIGKPLFKDRSDEKNKLNYSFNAEFEQEHANLYYDEPDRGLDPSNHIDSEEEVAPNSVTYHCK